jgi:CDP-diacylglycerol--serine O-phosphatidyltransferase
MEGLFPPVDPEASRGRPRRRLVPLRAVLPNLVTLLGLCAGLTAIRMAIEGRFDMAIAAIVFAIVLDGIDGRLARYFRATSRFGEQLDSLADFANFAVAPALFLYVWRLDQLSSLGWISALVLAICTALRLARFNVAVLSEEPRPDWHRDFFTGVPSPAGAGIVLLPFLLERVASSALYIPAPIVALYVVLVALLMVSRIPTSSGKRFGQRIPRENVLPVLVIGVLLVALLLSYPFTILTIAALAYLLHMPFAWRAHGRAAARASQAPTEPPAGQENTTDAGGGA